MMYIMNTMLACSSRAGIIMYSCVCLTSKELDPRPFSEDIIFLILVHMFNEFTGAWSTYDLATQMSVGIR